MSTTNTRFCSTPQLRVAYRDEGPRDGHPVLLLHGWPDEPGTWDGVAPVLHATGWRTIRPWLRGFGETRFLDAAALRSGEIVALARDTLELADALGIERFAVVGHDWGARIAYLLASTEPARVSCCAALSVGWDPGEAPTPALPQTRAYWYHWFMATARGERLVHDNGKAARMMWDSWGPPGWFDDAQFDAAAAAFDNPDWAAITVHSYRVRWQEAEPDPRYAAFAAAARAARTIGVPTLLLQGDDDRVALPVSSEDKQRHFTAGYERRLLAGIGHFPTREAPGQTAALIADFLASAPR